MACQDLEMSLPSPSSPFGALTIIPVWSGCDSPLYMCLNIWWCSHFFSCPILLLLNALELSTRPQLARTLSGLLVEQKESSRSPHGPKTTSKQERNRSKHPVVYWQVEECTVLNFISFSTSSHQKKTVVNRFLFF
jgi:hypothetical protein